MASIAFDLLDPIPYGCFVGALIFDGVYADNAEILWVKAAAWLIAIGLVFAVIPRLLNLANVWFRNGAPRPSGAMGAFWLNALAIVAAILNSFVHSRDAYAVMPQGLWLSCATVVLLVVAKYLPFLHITPGFKT